MLARQTVRRLVRQAPLLSPADVISIASRTFSTDFVFDEENFRAPELPDGLKVPIARVFDNKQLTHRLRGFIAIKK